MTVEGLSAITTLLLEYQYLIRLYIIGEYRSFYYCSINIWSSDLDCSVCIDEKHLVDLESLILLLRKTVYVDL